MERIERTNIQTVVLDAGPLIHLEELDRLDLLLDFHELIVPAAVWREVEYHRPPLFKKETIPLKKVQAVQNRDIHLSSICSSLDLDEGEMQALTLCLHYPHAILLTDDAAARLAANGLRIRAYGTIGILLRAIRRNQLTPSDVIRTLEEIPAKSTLFIRQRLLKKIIDEVKVAYSNQQ